MKVRRFNLKKNGSFLLCLLLSPVMFFPAGGWAGTDARTYYNEGTKKLRDKKFDAAIADLTSAIQLLSAKEIKSSDDRQMLSEAYNNRGLGHYEKKEYPQAQQDFFYAYIWNRQDTKAISNLGLIYYVQNKYDSAKLWYNLAIQLSTEDRPFFTDVYNNLGVCYAETGDTANALLYYNKAIHLVETSDAVDYSDAYYNRGNLYYNDKNYDAALADYTVTIEYYTGAKNVQAGVLDKAYHNRALCYYNKGLYQEAIDDYTRALAINPGYAWAHYGKGYSHFMLNQNDSAIAEFESILNSEIDPQARFGLGLALVRKGDFTNGMKNLHQSCDAGCSEACETLDKNMYANPGVMLNFQLPQ